MYLTTVGGPWYFWPLFGEQTSRILEPSPQGLISSNYKKNKYIINKNLGMYTNHDQKNRSEAIRIIDY